MDVLTVIIIGMAFPLALSCALAILFVLTGKADEWLEYKKRCKKLDDKIKLYSSAYRRETDKTVKAYYLAYIHNYEQEKEELISPLKRPLRTR